MAALDLDLTAKFWLYVAISGYYYVLIQSSNSPGLEDSAFAMIIDGRKDSSGLSP